MKVKQLRCVGLLGIVFVAASGVKGVTSAEAVSKATAQVLAPAGPPTAHSMTRQGQTRTKGLATLLD